MKYLLDHGAKVTVVDAAGRTPIDAAKGNGSGGKEAGSQEIVTLLKSAGTAPN